MTLWQKIKQLYISLRLEKNPYYYALVDIQKAIDDLHHIMTQHQLQRHEMKDATVFITQMKGYKRTLSIKTPNSDSEEVSNLLADICRDINSIQEFIKKVHDENGEHVDTGVNISKDD